MALMMKLTDMTRSPGDPSVIASGPSGRGTTDRIAVGLGWFSLALGAAELVAAGPLARALGMQGKEGLLRAYGVREVLAGVTSLSPDKTLGIWSRVGGDMMDIATLMSAYSDDNPKKGNVGLALAAVVGITLLDIVTAQGLKMRHSRGSEPPRDFSDRSGWPGGIEAARNRARPDGGALAAY